MKVNEFLLGNVRINFGEKGNYRVVNCNRFAWDGCHKIYLITTPEQQAEAARYNYDILDTTELPRAWKESCSLRFIEFWDVENIKYPIIPQCTDARIKLDRVTGDVTITPYDPEPDALTEFISNNLLYVCEGE